MKIKWEGQGIDEKVMDENSGKCIVKVDPRYFRPTEVDSLLGNPGKAKEKLGWQATTSFEDLVAEMVKEDLHLAERDVLCLKEGYKLSGQKTD